MGQTIGQLIRDEWVSFPGGELEGKRPKAMCSACRELLNRAAQTRQGVAAPCRTPCRTLCFQCYRAEINRERALKAAGELDTASAERFQDGLPFDPVNRARLDMLKAERAESRSAMSRGIGRFDDKRRQAQIAARHALQQIAAGLSTSGVTSVGSFGAERAWSSATHAAELQLPESWLPFVVSR